MRYFKVPYYLMERDDLSNGEKLFLLELMQKESEFNKEGKWFDLGYNSIPMDHKTLNKYRQSLKEKGLLDYKNGNYDDGKRHNSQYLLKIEREKPTAKEDNNQKQSPKQSPNIHISRWGKEIDESY